MTRIAALFGTLTLACVLVVLLAIDGPPPKDGTPTAKVVIGVLDSKLSLRGELDAGSATTIASSIAGDRGVLISIIEEGRTVEPGSVLATLDPAPFELRAKEMEDLARQRKADEQARAHAVSYETQQAAQAVENARLELELAKLEQDLLVRGTGPEEIARLEREASIAQRESERFASFLEELDSLISRGALSEPEIRRTRAEADQAEWEARAASRALTQYRDLVLPAMTRKAQVRVARAESALGETERMSESIKARVGDELAAAKAARERAERDAQLAREDVARTQIRATRPGIVVHAVEYRGGEQRPPRVGDRVYQGQPLIHLPDLSTMVIRSRVREVDLHRLAVGDQAMATIDAFPALRVQARVVSIGVLASPRDDRTPEVGRTFSVDLVIENPDERLRPGMTARALIDASDGRPGPLVPRQAIFEIDGSAYCYVRTGSGTFEPRPVRVGALGDFHAVIESGLAEHEEVTLVDPTALGGF